MSPPTKIGAGLFFALWAGFAIAALAILHPALAAPFFSDDYQYIVNNPYIQGLAPAQVAALFDPLGDPSVFTWNYAPVHLLAHALEWQVFGGDPFGYHLINIALHAGVSALLVLLFARWGLPPLVAVGLGVIFLVHPANVEVTAWIFQLKTILALGLSLGALLLFSRRPLLALCLFGLAMLSKVAAVYALPTAAVWLWCRPGRRADWGWLAAWAGVTLLCLAAEFPHFQNAQVPETARYPEPGIHVRSIVAIAGRYLVMAMTTRGLSAFHEPTPSVSWTEPWWLFGLVAVSLAGWRALRMLRERRIEAGYWVWAASSFALVSQIFPFLYPVGDRYLYMILPGLLGAFALALGDAFTWVLGTRQGAEPPHDRLRTALLVVGLGMAALFGFRSVERAELWRSDIALVRDSAAHYPEGRAGVYLRARRAAARLDYASAVTDLDRLADLGFDGFTAILQDPTWAPLRKQSDFQAVVARMAGNWIRGAETKPVLLQSDLRVLALAYAAQGNLPAAIEAYERALDQGGPLDAVIRQELTALRAR